MTETKLKLCPFCSGKARLIKTAFPYFFVRCNKCGVSFGLEYNDNIVSYEIGFKTKRTAIKRWDKRVGEAE